MWEKVYPSRIPFLFLTILYLFSAFYSSSSQEKCTLYSGLTVAFQRWGSPAAPIRVVALHGWLDNSNTWYEPNPNFQRSYPALFKSDVHILAVRNTLAPLLVGEGNIQILAIDFAGHGLSSHRPRDSHYPVVEHAADVVGFAEKMGWSTYCLLCHSMGVLIDSHFFYSNDTV